MTEVQQTKSVKDRVIPILRLLGGGVLLYLALTVLFVFVTTTDSTRAGREVDYFRYLVGNLKSWSTVIVYAPVIFALARSDYVSSANILKRSALWFVMLVGAFSFMLAFTLVTAGIFYGVTAAEIWAEQQFLFWTPDLLIVVCVMIAGQMSAVSKKRLEAEQAAEDLKQAVTDQKAELQARETEYLRGRLGNHFVMNGLSNLVGLIRLGRYQDAEDATLQLGDILRSISGGRGSGDRGSDYQGRDMVPLHREIELAEKYLAFQEVRFPKLKSLFDVADDVQDIFVPRQILQPIIENAFKHNDLPPEPEITIRAKRHGETILQIQVDSSNMAAFADVAGTGEGLRLTTLRLKLAYEDSATVHRSFERNVYRVTIGLPIPEEEGLDDAPEEEEVLLVDAPQRATQGESGTNQ